MLIDHVIKNCDNGYKSHYSKCRCVDCQHTDECSGGCKKCLEEIHYPSKYQNGKKDYDCSNLMNFYMCDYTFKYASEMLYLLRKSECLKDIEDYHIMSIGCGGCPDLMAFEAYVNETGNAKRIQYYGIDRNNLWEPIHQDIDSYCQNCTTNMKVSFAYKDAIDYFNKKTIKGTNVIVIQYLISHLYNTNQILKINSFYDSMIQNIIKYRQINKPCVILINDVNSCYRGRNYFCNLCNKLSENDLHGLTSMYYFDYNIQNEKQKYGIPHTSNSILFNIPKDFECYEPWKACSSAQLLIEIKKEE